MPDDPHGVPIGPGPRFLGVVFGLVAQVVTRKRGEFPFGPALAAACLVILYYAPDLRI